MPKIVRTHGLLVAVASASITMLAAAQASRADQLPTFGGGSAPPPKVLGCELTQAPSSLQNCLNAAVKKLNDDVANAKKAADAAQQQLQKPLVGAMSQLDAAQLTSCLAGKGINLKQSIAGIAKDPTAYVRTKLTELWQQGMNSTALINGQLAAIPPGGPAPTPEQLINNADQLLASLAAQDPAAQCVWASVQPFRAQARAIALQVYPTAKAQYDAMIDRSIKPAIERATVTVLKPAIRQLQQGARGAAKVGAAGVRTGVRQASSALPPEVQLIAIAQAQRYLLDPGRLAAISANLGTLSGALQNTNAVAATGALANLEREIPAASVLSDAVALDVGIETLRYFGHELIDEKGPELGDVAFVVVDEVTVGVINLVTGVVGIWWEPAEAVGEVVTFLVGVALMATKPAVKMALVKGTHAAYDQAVNAAHRALREKKPPSAYLQSAGPLGELLSEFPTEVQLLGLVVPEIQGMQSVLANYHQAVLGLGRAAGRQAGAGR